MEYQESDRREIIKSNYLIESSYNLTAMENKIIYLGITKLERKMIKENITISEVQSLLEETKFPMIYIDTCDFAKEFKIKTGNIYFLLEEAVKRLFNREIIYVNNEGVTKKRWIITLEYSRENARVALKFHQDLIPDLLVFKDKYTILKLMNTINIKSGHTYRLYELLKQYINFGFRIFEIQDFRFKFNIADDEYPLYANLKQSIINPAIKNINKTTDIDVSFTEIKEKRKVVKIKFFIKQKENYISNVNSKKQMSLFDTEEEIIYEGVEENSIILKLQHLLNYDITAGQAQKILDVACKGIEKIKKNNQDFNMDVFSYIIEKKKVIDEYGKNNKIESYIGTLISALIGNWTRFIKEQENIGTFNNFEQRTYDFEDLEKKLLGWNK